MTAPDPTTWPTARLDNVRRLRVLADALPGVHYEERELAVPFADLWTFLIDVERSIPQFDASVRRVEVKRREGNRLRMTTAGRFGPAVPLDATIEDGFMWMQAPLRLYVVGIAAVPVDDARTRYAQLEGVAARGGRAVRSRVAHHVRRDVANLEHLMTGR